jgi:hypothetical protein
VVVVVVVVVVNDNDVAGCPLKDCGKRETDGIVVFVFVFVFVVGFLL